MFGIPITERGHRIIEDYMKKGDVAVDCTAGRGEDTLFLAQCVGEGGRVLAFDVQADAIHGLHERFDADYPQIQIHQANNRDLADYIDGKSPQVIMYNLGYLPGGDHAVTTVSEDSTASIRRACEIVAVGGLISVITYPGHPEGAIEAKAVEELLRALSSKDYEVLTITQSNRSAATPVQHLVYRRR